jgi:ABC-2 type transport system ATP-binding protein
VIECRQLSKTYQSLLRGRTVCALDDLTLTVGRGEVVGIAGPNGAGKSTFISLLLGFLQPSAGTVRLDGLAPRAYIERSGAGYLTELVAIPPRWTVASALQRFACLAALPAEARGARVEELVAQLGLVEHRQKQVRQLSKGNLQRLGLAQALLADSDLVILDEPTHGLDPLWTQRFRDVVQQLRRPGRVILIASHNLDELERLADRVAILHQGRLQRVVGAGAPAGTAAPAAYRLVLAEPHADLGRHFAGAAAIDGRANEFRVSGGVQELNRSLAELLAAGGIVRSFYPEQSRLESEFRAAVGEAGR